MQGLKEAWSQLDTAVDKITTLVRLEKEDAAAGRAPYPSRGRELERIKASARGKAEILALFMSIYGPWDGQEKSTWTADDVSTEAGKRHAMRARGTEYFTLLTTGQRLQYDADVAWKRHGHGFVRVTS